VRREAVAGALMAVSTSAENGSGLRTGVRSSV
jgi:hypothetical protein